MLELTSPFCTQGKPRVDLGQPTGQKSRRTCRVTFPTPGEAQSCREWVEANNTTIDNVAIKVPQNEGEDGSEGTPDQGGSDLNRKAMF